MSQTPSNHERLKALFADAIDLPPDQRAALLASIGAEDQALARALERMIAAHLAASHEGGFLEDPTLDPTLSVPPTQSVGPFTLLKLIGEGGFGEVYLAEQSHPINRKVALKLIKLGMDSRQIMARFDAERQALAIMDHPNIARVYDAGTDERGRPWFAMEYVDGDPIHTFADKHRFDLRSRIELMIPVCRAVHHAHQKGVIHRDLKPSNVLVSMVDGKAVPRVIDFGIAKALDRPLTDKTIFTELRSLVGTPEYMSPEQADLGGGDIDTRSDVYSLGVLLYELLVGATPFDGKDLRSRAFGEIQRILREVDPPTPSTRFYRLERRASAAADRSVEPAKLSSSLKGELDWLAMKCLEKDRSRRYDSAAALADELARYLEDKPIQAGPVSRTYRARKFARRHRVGVMAAGLVSAGLLLGAAGIVWGSIEARRERDLAVHARESAERSRAAESEAKSIAQEHNEFLRDMFTSIDPSVARGKEISVREVLDAAAGKIDAHPPANPNVEAALRSTFGIAYSSLGALEPARKQLERSRALGDRSFQTTYSLIDVMRYQGELEAAYGLAQDTMNAPSPPEGSDEFWRFHFRMLLANVLAKQEKNEAAEVMLRSVIDDANQIATTRPTAANYVVVDASVTLAAIMSGDGRFVEAERVLKQALETTRERGEMETPAGIEIASNLGDVYRSLGRLQEAVALLEPTRRTAIKVLGADHPGTLAVENNLALILMTIGRLDESEPLFDEVIDRRTRLLGADHASTLIARSNRGLLYQKQERLDLAESEFADLSKRYTRVLGPDNYSTIVAENNYATLLLKRQRVDEAIPLLTELVERGRRTQGDQGLVYHSLTLRLANAYSLKRDFTAAEPLYARAFAGAEAMGIADAQAGYALGYGLCLSELGKAEQAIQVLARADAALRRMPNPDPVGLQKLAEAMSKSHAQLGHEDEAHRWQDAAAGPSSRPSTQPQRQ
jgi:non-specific serine/threonine protein kinase/serine/threonine-protein kinase